MKNLLYSFSLTIAALGANAQSGYDIKINLKNAKDKEVYLAYYQFDKTYLADTCKNVVEGNIRFKGKKNLDKGVYCLISQDKKLYFDFLVDEKNQKQQIETAAENIIENLKSPTSAENSGFFDYMKFITSKNREFEAYLKETKGMNKKDSVAFLAKKRTLLDESVARYNNDFLAKNQGTYVGDIINLKTDKVAKDIPLAANNRPDSTFAYKYYRKHFWDGVNFQDDGMVRTPFFAPKVKNFFEHVLPQHPDTISAEIDRMMAKTKAGTKMNAHLLAYFTSTFENYKLMGFDKVFVHLSDTYYKTGKAKDVYDEYTIRNIIKKADILKPLLIGKKAPELYMIDKAGHEKIAQLGFDKAKTSEEITKIYNDNVSLVSKLYVPFHNIKADYMLLVFWDVDCSHCKQEMPKLKKLYDELRKEGKDLKIYAVYTQFEFDKYQKYLEENNLTDWINVYDGVHINNLKDKYDIYSTPVIYVLDKDKTIKAKRIGVEQIKDIIEQMDKEYKNAKS